MLAGHGAPDGRKKVEPAPGWPDYNPQTCRVRAPGFFAGFNRNKRSVAIDLKPPGRAGGGASAGGAPRRRDIVLENYGPATMERLGCG